MASNPDLVQYIADQMARAGEITFKKMFGEYGLYCNEKNKWICRKDASTYGFSKNSVKPLCFRNHLQYSFVIGFLGDFRYKFRINDLALRIDDYHGSGKQALQRTILHQNSVSFSE